MAELFETALGHLKALTVNPQAEFRPGQFEAIQAVLTGSRKALVIERTGWGKSAVYFIATKILRQGGSGPTVIVSPLLALMRNQTEAADRLDLNAKSVNSTNPGDWDEVFSQIDADEVDVLLISPERLNNPRFRTDILPGILNRMGLLVIDEVHCISDWGHDFRPNYRRLERVVAALPPRTPVLGTTATANDRVIDDVAGQLGSDLEIIRGTLDRQSLALQVIEMPKKAERMAWLAETVPQLAGSGIIYTLTIADATRTAAFLRSRGIEARAYTGPTASEDRLEIERLLSENSLKVVVATSALAMGYDNPFIEFVIHFQVPGSAISYYQQVGRAGRAVESSFGIALAGSEDRRIQDYFIETAFPTKETVDQILDALSRNDGLRLTRLLTFVNIRHKRLESAMNLLEVEGAVYKEDSVWYRSASQWVYPAVRFDQVTQQRRIEQEAMAEYVTSTRCLMQQLRELLDDPSEPCGRCSNCAGRPLVSETASPEAVFAAERFLSREEIEIPPKKRNPSGVSLDLPSCEPGRTLVRYENVGLGGLVIAGKYETGVFDDALVDASVSLINRWLRGSLPDWVTAVPDSKRSGLVESLAGRIAARLGLPYRQVLIRTGNGVPQKEMENSSMQATNALSKFIVSQDCGGSVLLVDDIIDSGWTVTVAAHLLRESGATTVYPFALADAGHS